MIYLAQYRTHQTVTELDSSVKEHIYNNFDKLTKSDKAALSCLATHSLQHVGACHLKTSTIAEEIGKSESTVKRSIKRLSEIGIIEIVNTSKMNGIKGANIYRINFFNQNMTHREMNHRATHETPRISKDEHVKSESVSFKSFNLSVVKNVVNNVNAHCSDTELKLQLRGIYNPLAVEGNQAFEELCKIAFGRLKQYMQSHKVPYLQMEQIVLKAMRDLVRKQNIKNEFAMYSAMIKRQVEQLFEAPVNPVHTFNKLSRELIPDWFDKRNEPSTEVTNNVGNIDFEAERQKILAKLG